MCAQYTPEADPKAEPLLPAGEEKKEEAVPMRRLSRASSTTLTSTEEAKPATFWYQLKVMLVKKHYVIRKRSMGQNFQLFGLPLVALLLCFLLYVAFPRPGGKRTSSGFLELLFTPIALVMLMQALVVTVVAEKASRMLESMKIMSLRESVYWTAHTVEAAVAGALVAFLVACLSSATGLYRMGPWEDVFGLIFAFACGVSGLAFAVSSVFGTPQTAGQVALAIQGASIIVYLVVLKPDVKIPQDATASELRLWSLLPHVALELGVNSFRGPPNEGKHARPNKFKRFVEGCHTSNVQYSIGCNTTDSFDDDYHLQVLYNETYENGTAWDSATYRKYYVYTQYHGIPLSTIIGMLFIDAAVFSLLSWYLAQVIPSTEFGTTKPWYFLFLPSYWLGTEEEEDSSMKTSASSSRITPEEEGEASSTIENPLLLEESSDVLAASSVVQAPSVAGSSSAAFEPTPIGAPPPTVKLRHLRKTFGSFVAVDDLTLDMREGEVFSLLGHNGAGKSTSINVLTGLLPSSSKSKDGGATIYGHGIKRDMERVRLVTGVCPQHDVLFDLLTAYETLDLFASLKGSTDRDAKAEADELLERFHLSHRKQHKAQELSGGMKRKLSTAVALCGRSKFCLLDEPTAGMDALARRELWDLIAEVKKGRTMVLCTHYLDEADILGDKVGIMSHGKLKCYGTSAFLKSHFGAGYRVVCRVKDTVDVDVAQSQLQDALAREFLAEGAAAVSEAENAAAAPGTTMIRPVEADATRRELTATLPRGHEAKYARFFGVLDKDFVEVPKGSSHDLVAALKKNADAPLLDYGLAITTLEDVFLAVGGDETVAPAVGMVSELRIGAGRRYEAGTYVQAAGIFEKRLRVASRDFKTLALLLLPIGGVATAFALNSYDVITQKDKLNDMITAAICAGSFLIYPALVAENVVSEKENKLRNVLSVAGCEVRAYWLGTFFGDYVLFLIVSVAFWIAAGASGLPRWLENAGIFYFVLLFGAYLLTYSYSVSFLFETAKRCVIAVPGLQIVQLLSPDIIGLLVYLIVHPYDDGFDASKLQGMLLWLLALLSPQGAFWIGFYNIASSLPIPQQYCPRFYEVMLIMAAEGWLFSTFVLARDLEKLRPLVRDWPDSNVALVAAGDDDVKEERNLVIAAYRGHVEDCEQRAHATASEEEVGGKGEDDGASEDLEQAVLPAHQQGKSMLVVARLRKVYPAKLQGAPDTVAVHDVTFRVAKGEVFGLLGANGAGKSSVLNCVIRASAPTTGDILVDGHSVLDDFENAAKSLGVVTQGNSLWDLLSCYDHLKLFAQLRGVPGPDAARLVEAALDQLELRPHKNKLAHRLSGGMKRKLCVAIAVVGDPALVLLDEPSAGLDPVSRRNLWNVLRSTMESRAVVLTSHLMPEVEALCDRVAIMVKAKLRCLGTIQHLKDSLGSNYEVEISAPGTSEQDQQKVHEHVYDTFGSKDSVAITSTAGGLLAYEVDKKVVNIGHAFASLEKSKADLGISSYTIAQPSLESVFIKTVQQYDADAEFALLPKDDEAGKPAEDEKRMTGCTRTQLKRQAWICGLLTFVLVLVSFAVKFAGIIVLPLLIASIWGCVGCCCVLRREQVVDEDRNNP